MSLLSVRIDRGKSRRCIVVGAGLSGLSVAAALCARGTPVLLLSLAPPLRARSASRHEGLGSTSLAAEDAPLLHAEDTLRAGAWLADGVPVQGLCRAAPQILEMFAHLGVPFERTAAGLVKGHQQFGHSQARVAHAGWNTGHHLVASLNALLSYYETIDARDPRGLTVPGEKLLRRLEHWDFVRLVRDDDGTVVGVVAQDLKTLQFKAFPADGVCLSSGGFSGLYPNACAPQYEIGAPLGSAASEGALLANPELIQLGLLNLGEGTRPRSLGASLLAYGARLFVVKAKDKREPHEIPEKERDYLLERPGQRLGASSTEASGSPEWALARQLCLRGPDSPRLRAFLDLSSLAPEVKAAVRRQYAAFLPSAQLLPVRPAIQETLGGLWVDYETNAKGKLQIDSPRSHATSLPGLYAAGSAEYQYHGAGHLAGNGLLASAYAGELAARGMMAHRQALTRSAFDLPASLFDKLESSEEARFAVLLEKDGTSDATNPFLLLSELSQALEESTLGASGSHEAGFEKLEALEPRIAGVRANDDSKCFNQGAVLARQLPNLYVLAKAAASGYASRLSNDELDPKTGLFSTARGERPRTTWIECASDDSRRVSHFSYTCAGQSVTLIEPGTSPSAFPPPHPASADARVHRAEPS